MGGRGTSSGGGGSGRIFHTLPQANDFFGVEQDTGMFPEWLEDASTEEEEAIKTYTKNAYEAINAYLRGGEEGYQAWLDDNNDYYFHGNIEAIQQTVARIESAIDKFDLRENITVWRGGSNKLVGGATSVEELKAMVGSIVRDNGVMSTAVTEKGMWSTTGSNIGYEIHVPKGRGHGAFVDPISEFQGEEEFAFKPGTQFKITGAYTDTHGNVICKLRAVFPRRK